jgi:hypothetical protein
MVKALQEEGRRDKVKAEAITAYLKRVVTTMAPVKEVRLLQA